MSRVAALALTALTAAGCHATNRVRPEQLPRANGSFIDTVEVPIAQYNPVSGNFSMGSVTGIRNQSKIEFDRPEGGKVTVKGQLDVNVTTVAGRRYRFEHPVHVTLENDVLDLRSSSRSGRVRLDEVRAAEVRSFDMPKTVLAGSAVGVGVALLSLALLFAI